MSSQPSSQSWFSLRNVGLASLGLLGFGGITLFTIYRPKSTGSENPATLTESTRTDNAPASVNLDEENQGGPQAVKIEKILQEGISSIENKENTQLSAVQDKEAEDKNKEAEDKNKEAEDKNKEVEDKSKVVVEKQPSTPTQAVETLRPNEVNPEIKVELEAKDAVDSNGNNQTASIPTLSPKELPPRTNAVFRTNAVRRTTKPEENQNTDIRNTESGGKEDKSASKRKIYNPFIPESVSGNQLPYQKEYTDDLAGMDIEAADDSKLLIDLEESNKRNLEEETKHNGETKGPFRSRVFVYNGNITTVGTDAIVNAANRKGLGGGGIDEAIHASVGGVKARNTNALRSSPLKTRVANFLNVVEDSNTRCPTGTARVVSVVDFKRDSMTSFVRHLAGGKYTLSDNTRFIFQAVGPDVQKHLAEYKNYEYLLHSAYMAALNNAKKTGVRHVAFNCISTAKFAYPKDDAAMVAVGTVSNWMRANLDSKLKVVFVLFGDEKNKDFQENIKAYRKYMEEYFPYDE